MEISDGVQFPARLLSMISLFTIFLSLFVVAAATELLSIHVAQPTILQLSSGSPVENSPGTKRGALVVCERVHIHGMSRLQHLRKYAHSVKVKVKVVESNLRVHAANAEVCFHRNTSLGIGMCPQGQWEKVVNGSWVHSMSPYDDKLLDIRMPGQSLENLEVSIEEEFMIYRIIFLVLGVVMLTLAPSLSMSIVFYYSGAMAVGVILVILMVLFQGMKLLPTGRKNSLAIVIYSSVVGVGSFLLRYLPRLLQSLLVEIGISDDMYNPLVMFLLVCIILTGAWLGFWAVHSLVLTEEGSIDSSVALLVAWSIRIFAAFMIMQSSLDPLLAIEALVLGLLVSSIMRGSMRLRFLRHLQKHLFRTAKSHRKRPQMQDAPPEDSYEYLSRLQRPEEVDFIKQRTKRFGLASCNSPVIGLTKTTPSCSSYSETYYSTFHNTPEKKRFSREEWEKFTKDSTKSALQELVSSPDFSKWASRNAERLTLSPADNPLKQRLRWFHWF